MNYESALNELIKNALKEDVGNGDHSTLSTINAYEEGKAVLKIKQDGVLAGIDVAETIFRFVQPDIIFTPFKKDGDTMKYGEIAFEVSAKVHTILTCERLVLNSMQRMSGIATLTKKYVDKLSGFKTKLLDTRKTTPNFRLLEKAAVRIGGGKNHRFGLYDMILIKDNHVDYAGGTAKAIEAAKSYLKTKDLDIPIEIEVRNVAEITEVLNSSGVDRILLDNFTFEKLKEAVILINKRFITEASGGITEDNVLEYAQCGVDYVSMGALTHSVKSLDMSLKATQSN